MSERRILLYDDCDTDLMILEGIIKDLGYTTISTKDWIQTSRILSDNPIDAALFDYNLTSITLESVIRGCRAVTSIYNRKMPPVGIVSSENKEILETTSRAGANGYFPKTNIKSCPYDFKAWLDALVNKRRFPVMTYSIGKTFY